MNWKLKTTKYIEIALLLILLGFVNTIGEYVYYKWDVTEDKRYTLTESSTRILQNMDSPIFIEVLMGGNFPAGFSRLQQSVEELLLQFRLVNASVDFVFTDPSAGTREEINEFRKNLAEDNIYPINLRYGAKDKLTEKLIYPYAFIRRGNNYTVINLLEQKILGVSDEENLNNSMAMLEFKFISAIERLKKKERSLIAFSKGHGELPDVLLADFTNSISDSYVSSPLNLDSVTQISDKIKLLIIARPTEPFGDKDKFKIDQYIMRGGKVMFLLDQFNASKDSMRLNSLYIPNEINTQLDDLLFKYGARINKDLILDKECGDIVLVVGREGGRPQMDSFKWFYDPISAPNSNHPVVKGLDRVQFNFVSSIDTVKTLLPTQKTILLSSSNKSRLQFSPIRLSFEILRNPPGTEMFNKEFIPMAVLLEGPMSSLYARRVTPEMQKGLSDLGQEFKDQTDHGMVLVVGDGDVIRNEFNPLSGEISALGYNRFSQYTFANKPFFINALEYMLDESGVIDARSKTLKMRLLDAKKIDNERAFWQILNIVFPMVFILIFGLLYTWIRKRRFA
jgi:ABC-2 type transport system permease protein